MASDKQRLHTLLIQLENLLLRQQSFESEIVKLRQEVRLLQSGGVAPAQEDFSENATTVTARVEPIQATPASPEMAKQPIIEPPTAPIFPPINKKPSFSDNFTKANFAKSDFEKFIGENLISKIGILILIIGVAIGAKYAIENEMLSPLTRIILGYAVGVALMVFALKLKAKYESFSAVLLSGGIAILYFLTYAAYDFYHLIPQGLAFVLMVIFTSFTVVAAIKYNQQVIAHIGLVGAYGVPFLLSEGSGQVAVLFSYIAIINIGILILSFKRYWKPLFYLSFGLTWLIFASWLFAEYKEPQHFNLALGFASVFFATFYVSNLAYKVTKAEIFGTLDVIILLLNSFAFYGIGYYLLSDYREGELLGLFTLFNAIIHFVVCLVIYKRKLADRNLFYFILAMVITFITMAVPVQLSGSWVTVFWIAEATILFYLGRSKNIAIYEKLSFPLIFLAFISLLQDWTINSSEFNYLGTYIPTTPFLNVGFLTAVIFTVCSGLMFLINRKPVITAPESEIERTLRKVLNYAIPSMLILVIYYGFRIEIANIFRNLFENSKINAAPKKGDVFYQYNFDYMHFKTISIYIYSLLFASALTYVNIKKIKSTTLAMGNLIINTITVIGFLTLGLLVLSQLRENYMAQDDEYFISGPMNIGIRYAAILSFAVLISACYQLAKADFFKFKLKLAFDYLLYVAILWVLSSELLHWLSLSGLSEDYKLGLSILWGAYALFLISMGIWKNKKHLRFGAMVLFGVTLIKLFFYDISYLGTIAKTVVFVSLGVLLLIISFLYNKYKHLIIDDVKVEN